MTGTFVEPAGIVITGPSGSGCHSVVLSAAGIPRLAIVRVSEAAPASITIESPALIPVVLVTLIVLSPLRAAAASPELESPST